MIWHGMATPGRLEALLAEVEGKAVGSRCSSSYSTWAGKPILYVEDLFIDETMRGSGLGAKLMARLGRVALDRGGKPELLVAEENTARRFYESLWLARHHTWLPYAINGAPLQALADRDSV